MIPVPDSALITGQPVRLRWEQKGLDRVDAAFSIGTVAVRATFELGDHAWHASFKVKSDCAGDTLALAFHVFGGVFQAVHEFLVVREPEALVFATDKEELAQVYRAYLGGERLTIEGLGYSLDLAALAIRQSRLEPAKD